jgi:hypothetical protein
LWESGFHAPVILHSGLHAFGNHLADSLCRRVSPSLSPRERRAPSSP